jgi:predicted transcriptional regulator
MNKFEGLAREVRELSKEYHNYVGEYSHGTATGWHILTLEKLNAIYEELKRFNANIEGVQERLDEMTIALEDITFATHGQIEKSDLMREVEERFGRSIYELLEERKGKSVREIADELGVSKSTISNWRKEVER